MIEVSIAHDIVFNSLSEFAQLLYLKILPHTDDYGRFEGNPTILKARVDPLSMKKIEAYEDAMLEISRSGLWLWYVTDKQKLVIQFNYEAFKRINAFLIKKRGNPEYEEYIDSFTVISGDIDLYKTISNDISLISHRKYKVESNKYKVESNKSGKTNLVDELISIFSDLYQKQREMPYLKSEKDKKAVGMMLLRYRKSNPEADTEKCKSDMTVFFNQCLNISNKWLYENMTLSIANSKINEIRTILRGQHGRTDDLRELQQALDSF